MSWLSRLVHAFRSSDLDRALDEEMAFHIESRIADLVAGGMTRNAAEATARRRSGPRESIRHKDV